MYAFESVGICLNIYRNIHLTLKFKSNEFNFLSILLLFISFHSWHWQSVHSLRTISRNGKKWWLSYRVKNKRNIFIGNIIWMVCFLFLQITVYNLIHMDIQVLYWNELYSKFKRISTDSGVEILSWTRDYDILLCIQWR